VKYYFLDNEPGLWHDTHRDVQPTGATMAQVRDKIIAYSDMIRSVDPGAVIMGPEEWGWSGYFYSGYDLQWGSENGWNNLPDRAANGGKDFLPWLLQQLRARDLQTGKKSIDVFTVHYYPQSGEYGSSTTTTMQNRRNKSTRSLWDPTYVDQSWIGEVVQLIPLLKSWVNAYYPGLPVGITEYNWGAENHINGATTQADILGIFGREGLDLANYWTVPPTGSPVYNAFRMYRNYDGSKSTFGDVSVRATVPNPDNVSAFAAQRTLDGALTVMVINKQLSTAQAVTVGLANFASTGAAQVWQLTSSNSITRLADATVTNNTITATLPAQSITLYVLPKQPEAPAGPPAPMKLRAVSGDTQASLTWLPAPGASSYRLYRAARSTGPWDLVQSTSSTATVDGGLVNGLTYYYAVRTVSGEAESVNSNLAAAKPQAAATDPVGPPGAPTRLKATPGDGTATLSWTPSVNAPFYRVYRSLSKTGPFGLRKTVKDPSWVDTAVTNGTLYYFAVTSMNSAGESAQSNIVVVRPGTVVVTTPPPPTFTASVGTPAWTPPGGTAAINLSVTCASSSLSNGVVALEIHSGSTRLHQELWTGQSFTSGQVRSYTYNWLAPSVPGNYTVKVGVYGPGSTPQYYWNGNAGTVTVTTPTFTSSVSVSPNPVSVGSNATITATVTCVSGALTDGVIDVEIYDANRVRRRQQFWLGQNLAAGETVTRTFTWAPSIASTYTVKVGVFGYDWDPLHDWNDTAGTFTAN
jgi:fibronectin type 3 domain-containing protein